jgi:hypothetical protein
MGKGREPQIILKTYRIDLTEAQFQGIFRTSVDFASKSAGFGGRSGL